jgi:type I restriction enzyme S subunit
MNNSLPPNWSWVKLADVCEPIDKVNGIKKSGSFYYLDIGGINNKNNLVKTVKEYKWEKAPSRAKQIVKDGDILFSTVRTYLKNIAKVPTAYNNQIASTGFCVIRPKNNLLNSNFIFYLTLSNKFLEPLNALQVGSSYPAVRNGDVLKQPIPLPPLPDQKKIVEKIEELFSGLDSGVASLKKAKEQIRLYRQSVLASAFSGKLLTQSAERQAHSELPEGWKWVKLGEVAEIKRGKSKHRPRNDPKLYGGIYPFIQTGEIRSANGGIINSFIQTYNETGLAQSKLWTKGTLCVSIAANIGETAFLGFDSCFPDSIVGILPNDSEVIRKYINYYFILEKERINGLAPATAQKNINVDIIQKLIVPLPPKIQQTQIVEEIEKRFSEADNLEKAIDESLAKSETLRQSILKKAFEGRLV